MASWSTSNTIRADKERSGRIDDFVARQIGTDGPGLALAAVADGTVVHCAGYGMADVSEGRPVEPDTMFHLASCGKQWTGLGILMLVEDGKLGLDDPVGRHLPLLDGFGPGVTIRTLLYHTSGIRDLSEGDGVQQILAHCAQPTNVDVIQTYVDLHCPMANRRIKPGDTFIYSNSGYELLGSIIETVSGQSYRDFFAKRVFDPLEMARTFSAPDSRSANSATGYERDFQGRLAGIRSTPLDNLVGSGSFYTTVSDLCRYERALRTNRLVSEASLQEFFAGGRTNNGRPTYYGFGWYVETWRGISFRNHEGWWNGCQTYVRYGVHRPLSIFVLSNHPDADLAKLVNAVTDACR